MKFHILSLVIVFSFVVSCSSDPDTDVDADPDRLEDADEVIDPIQSYKYGEDYIVLESDNTSSDLDFWKKRVPGDSEYHIGNVESVNKGYLEFTGNNMNSGSPKSPLTYTFICPKTADYRIVMRMYQPLKEDEPSDKRNDVYIKLSGEFEAASSCVYPTETLKENNKFFGRGVRKWGSAIKMEAHVGDVVKKNKVIYALTKDKEYTLTISGRAQGCSIDYILFYNDVLNYSLGSSDDPAIKLPPEFMPDTKSTQE